MTSRDARIILELWLNGVETLVLSKAFRRTRLEVESIIRKHSGKNKKKYEHSPL